MRSAEESLTNDIDAQFHGGFTINTTAWLNRFMVDCDIIRVLKNHAGYKSWDDVPTTEREYCYKNYTSKTSLPMWNTVQENYWWSKMIVIWIFCLILLVTEADMGKKQLMHLNTQDLNIFCCCFVNWVELFLSVRCLCYILNYSLWWKYKSCLVHYGLLLEEWFQNSTNSYC